MPDIREFTFKLTDEMGYHYSANFEASPYDEDQHELDFYLEQFKHFLKMVGWMDTQLSRLQYLEDDNLWKKVLTEYGEWDESHEKVYQMRKH